MSLEKLFNVAGAIVTVALVSVIVGSKNTSGVIRAVGSAFSGALRAAKG